MQIYLLYIYIYDKEIDHTYDFHIFTRQRPGTRSIGTKLKYVMLPHARADKGAGLREPPGMR